MAAARCLSFAQPIYACGALRIPVAQFYLKHALLNFTVPIVYLLFVYLFAHSLIRHPSLDIFIIAILSCLVFVPYPLIFGMSSDERREILRAIMPTRGFFAKL
jgi:hypothetical protein